jgi:hypothetical protein
MFGSAKAVRLYVPGVPDAFIVPVGAFLPPAALDLITFDGLFFVPEGVGAFTSNTNPKVFGTTTGATTPTALLEEVLAALVFSSEPNGVGASLDIGGFPEPVGVD